MRANLEAFERWRIVPRMLRDVSERDLSVTVLGTAMPAPLLLAPIGVQSIVHPEGELAVARAAAAVGLPMILSTAVVVRARGGRRGRRRPELVPALLAAQPRARVEPRRPRRAAPATRRSCSPSTPSCRAGSRATSRAPGSRSSRASGSPTTPPTRSSESLLEKPARGGSAGGGRPVRRPVLEPRAELGRPRVPARRDRAADPDQGDPAPRRRADGRASTGSTGSSSPTTAAARSTARSPRSTRCRRSSTRSATSSRCCSTAACARAPTSPRRWRSAPTRSRSGGRTCGAWRSAARRACWRCCASVLAELDLTIGLSGHTAPRRARPGAARAGGRVAGLSGAPASDSFRRLRGR